MQLIKEEDLSYLERLSLINMSYSRFNTYEMCPSKYFYTYIQKEERVFGPAATLGNVIHSVLEDTVGEPLVYDHMLERMRKHREEFDPEHQIDSKLMTAGKTMLAEFVDRHGDEQFDVVGKELEFSVIIGSAVVRGFIDLVVRDSNGLLRVIDYKSGRWEVSYKDAPKNLQIGIYSLAMANMFPGEPVYAELYYLRSGRRKGHLFSPEDIGEVYNEVLRQVNGIINDRNFKATENSRPCSFCDFRKTGVCPVGVKRFGTN